MQILKILQNKYEYKYTILLHMFYMSMYIHLPDQFVPLTSEELSSEAGAVLAQ